MNVYVKSQSGKWLMPTNPANARILLKQGKAQVIQRTPFTIQLLYETTEHIQPVTVGIDDGGCRYCRGIPWSNIVSTRDGFTFGYQIKTGYAKAISKIQTTSENKIPETQISE